MENFGSRSHALLTKARRPFRNETSRVSSNKDAGNSYNATNLYYAKYDPVETVYLESAGRQLRVPVNLGLGINFFLNQMVSFKIDARSYLYQGPKPQYDPDVAVTENRLYNTLVTSLGASVFFPKMKPRMNY